MELLKNEKEGEGGEAGNNEDTGSRFNWNDFEKYFISNFRSFSLEHVEKDCNLAL